MLCYIMRRRSAGLIIEKNMQINARSDILSASKDNVILFCILSWMFPRWDLYLGFHIASGLNSLR